MNKPSWLDRLKSGLSESTAKLTDGIAGIFAKRKLDNEALEELEEVLITADLGPATAAKLAANLAATRFDKEVSDEEVRTALADDIGKILEPIATPLAIDASRKPHVVLVVGVNGSGKTTTIGKLAQHYRGQGLYVILAAGDTFRAAAVEQLKTWGQRNNVPVIAQGQNADSASVIFDAVQAAKGRGIDVIIADTAGRLHTQGHLMEELRKIKRVVQKHDAYAPHEVMLVVDATTGNNALNQAVQFHEAVGLTGITVTKLDGTARGGIVFAIAKRLGLPIRFVGVGESAEDLGEFNAQSFINALFEPAA